MVWSLLIVDDHPDFRRAARDLLASTDFVVVGEAADAAQAVALTRELDPGLVLLDIRLPDSDGFAVAEALAGLARPPVVVLTSSHDAAVYGDRLRLPYVRGFIGKGELSVQSLVALVGPAGTS